MAAYEIIINKKFAHVKLYTVLKSVKKGEQNKISKLLTGLTEKYLLKKNQGST